MRISGHKIFRSTIILVTIGLCLASCFDNWTPERRGKFERECLGAKTFGNVVFILRGFDNNEFDSILVRHYVDSLPKDSFNLHVDKAVGKWEKENKERTIQINRQLNIKDTYEFIIPGQKPYKLSNMKMVVWDQYTMSGEGHGCEMAEYTIDTIKFVDRPNPTFVKRQ